MSVSIGVVTFPGGLDDRDTGRAVRAAGAQVVPLWHADTDLQQVDAVVLPGGFSYGDYLRAGAIARFSPIMGEIIAAAGDGLPVLGICNGFQILCEAGLLPGVLTRNEGQRFLCQDVTIRIENTQTAWTGDYTAGQELLVPIKNAEGRYIAPAAELEELLANGQVLARYVGGNPNGSQEAIAGLRNAVGNVVGLMPHPEHAINTLTGPSTDGIGFFTSVVNFVEQHANRKVAS